MKVLKSWITFVLFAFFVAWLLVMTQNYKYERDIKIEKTKHIVDTIVVYKTGHDYYWELFTQALIWVESKGDSKAVGKCDDIGVLQIRPIIVEDCNRILSYERFTLTDRLDSLKSVEMFNIIQDHYNPQHDYHLALKIWNGHAPLSYHRKVMDKFNEIKNEAL